MKVAKEEKRDKPEFKEREEKKSTWAPNKQTMESKLLLSYLDDLII